MNDALRLAQEAHRCLVARAGSLLDQSAKLVEGGAGIGVAPKFLAGHGNDGQVDGENSCSARGRLRVQSGHELKCLIRTACAVERQSQDMQILVLPFGIGGHQTTRNLQTTKRLEVEFRTARGAKNG